MKEETCMLQDEINQKEKGCLQVAARSASRTFCSAKPAGGLRHMQMRSVPNFIPGFSQSIGKNSSKRDIFR